MPTLARTLAHLERLVAFDTRNPPRQIDGAGIFAYLRGALEPLGLRCHTAELGDGCVYLLATRGPTAPGVRALRRYVATPRAIAARPQGLAPPQTR